MPLNPKFAVSAIVVWVVCQTNWQGVYLRCYKFIDSFVESLLPRVDFLVLDGVVNWYCYYFLCFFCIVSNWSLWKLWTNFCMTYRGYCIEFHCHAMWDAFTILVIVELAHYSYHFFIAGLTYRESDSVVLHLANREICDLCCLKLKFSSLNYSLIFPTRTSF